VTLTASGTCRDPAHTVNVGVGGVCLETPHRLVVGAPTTLIVLLPGGEPLMVDAEVCDTREDGGGWVAHVAFRDLRPRDLDRLASAMRAADDVVMHGRG